MNQDPHNRNTNLAEKLESEAELVWADLRYVETVQVKNGVRCDVYSFENDNTRDLAIVHVDPGVNTPLQRVLNGTKTVEGFLEGKATLAVTLEDGEAKTYVFDSTVNLGGEVVVGVGQLMQWSADETTGLVFYEICEPPYMDDRFENLTD